MSSFRSKTFQIRGRSIDPALFLAPLAGVTHSAFRRLIADFGGYGALYTEMLAARALLKEDFAVSPYSRHRPEEGAVIYQLLVGDEDDIETLLGRLAIVKPFAIDINLGCPAPAIVRTGGGATLFRDESHLASVLRRCRGAWDGPLMVKCRLGDEGIGWEEQFVKRVRIFEEAGVDAVTVHPRFFGDKLKRRVRWELFPWICSLTSLPVIANGDLMSTEPTGPVGDLVSGAAGIMLGRIAVARPWIFSANTVVNESVDYREIWERFYRYTMEDFPPTRALGRIKEFNGFFSRNFSFGHELFAGVQSAPDPASARDRALLFLARSRQIVEVPTFEGL